MQAPGSQRHLIFQPPNDGGITRRKTRHAAFDRAFDDSLEIVDRAEHCNCSGRRAAERLIEVDAPRGQSVALGQAVGLFRNAYRIFEKAR
jgi:hypothetical protein